MSRVEFELRLEGYEGIRLSVVEEEYKAMEMGSAKA
jgi:hypothetical protein